MGEPLLRLFGGDFVSGYGLMFIISIGLLARAAVGPAERLLNMLGERRACALIYATSFAMNVTLCIVLIPWLGLIGAAIALRGDAGVRIDQPVPGGENPAGFPLFIFGRPRER